MFVRLAKGFSKLEKVFVLLLRKMSEWLVALCDDKSVNNNHVASISSTTLNRFNFDERFILTFRHFLADTLS